MEDIRRRVEFDNVTVQVQVGNSSWSGIFLCLIWGRITAPSRFKYEQKLPKMVCVIPNFIVIHFGENFMKIRSKIPKLQTHENFHKNVNENMFSFTFLCNFS